MIVELEQYTAKLAALRAQLKEVGEGLHIDDMERELSELREEMNADGFWDNLERSTYVNRRISNLESKIKHYEGLLSGCDDVETMMELAQEEDDEDMIAEAGVKSVTFEVSGDHAYGYLRSEKGVHRLVRISPFDANARRHTSFSSLDVAPVLEEMDTDIEIDMKDVRVDTYHSSGAGGQNVNKTSSAVRMTHFPTGIVVACQTERDQVQNRATCIKMLKAKLLELKEREREQEMADIKGEMKKIEWGSQIRSYVFQPYTMVKDHRTGFEAGNIDDVMNGNIEGFTTAYLKMQ